MICPNLRLLRLTSNFRIEFACLASAFGLNGFPAPANATLPRVSTAGVDQIAAPAKLSFGCFGGWIVYVFLSTPPGLASREFIDPWKAWRAAASPRPAGAPGNPRHQ